MPPLQQFLVPDSAYTAMSRPFAEHTPIKVKRLLFPVSPRHKRYISRLISLIYPSRGNQRNSQLRSKHTPCYPARKPSAPQQVSNDTKPFLKMSFWDSIATGREMKDVERHLRRHCRQRCLGMSRDRKAQFDHHMGRWLGLWLSRQNMLVQSVHSRHVVQASLARPRCQLRGRRLGQVRRTSWLGIVSRSCIGNGRSFAWCKSAWKVDFVARRIDVNVEVESIFLYLSVTILPPFVLFGQELPLLCCCNISVELIPSLRSVVQYFFCMMGQLLDSRAL